ncbi:hypothetical protein VSDG_01953 [Cytospora chrysosperma]|uniref:Uncharacterized protein n=1 Tax=Cytospora chrysosperma TaxID=252740 RepID=A0A423WHB4_CYTCH|nr:hypothetical protein VSDG_01953 [Valsa sordida]
MSSHFSDEFIAYAKEEDAANHQHTSNWIPCYVLITLVPFVFVGCAWWANRQRKAAKPPWRLFAGRRRFSSSSSRADIDDHNKAPTESIEMRDLEAAHTITATAMARTRTIAASITSPAATATWLGAGMAPPRSRAASGASDTGAVLGGDALLEDVDLAGGRTPRWLGRTALPGESSAFQFQPEGSEWPRHGDLVLVQQVDRLPRATQRVTNI